MRHNRAADGDGNENIPSSLSALNIPANAEGIYEAVFEGHSVYATVDSLASYNFLSLEEAKALGMQISCTAMQVELVNGSTVPVEGKISGRIAMDGHFSDIDVLLISMPPSAKTASLILGREWLIRTTHT